MSDLGTFLPFRRFTSFGCVQEQRRPGGDSRKRRFLTVSGLDTPPRLDKDRLPGAHLGRHHGPRGLVAESWP
jgi:hypothetical protein